MSHVRDIMAEIASASDEQSRGITQVSLAISEMDSTTQQNAALVEESAAAADSLAEQAILLAQAVAVFRLSEDEGATDEGRVVTPKALTGVIRQKTIGSTSRRAGKRSNPSILAGIATTVISAILKIIGDK